MGRDISEADWRHLRRLKPVALDRFCQRVLAEVTTLAAEGSSSAHERYLALFDLIQERDGDLADAFNNLRRSTALVQLTRLRSLGLVTDSEFDEFSAETREAVALFLKAWRD